MVLLETMSGQVKKTNVCAMRVMPRTPTFALLHILPVKTMVKVAVMVSIYSGAFMGITTGTRRFDMRKFLRTLLFPYRVMANLTLRFIRQEMTTPGNIVRKLQLNSL